ncbi:OmpA family protein [Micromonospora ureilytica]|uniref:Outer membrane protein OmpA-like peptidoglycan-associated protein n=1 Tax=Micromonospora ureilytica TaxID=709868 RepID=A0ABS0JFV9_9ACTN|nr:OmpA family protein [Micromonospora ureilytica]MBG6065946.1 outer membrane protein OmpA-like peptidoglycan-associated protein [Micromonospora ureilytica]
MTKLRPSRSQNASPRSSRRLALSAVLTLAMVGCGGPPNKDSPSPPASNTPVVTATATVDTGTSTGTALAETRSTMTENLKVEVVGLNRVKGRHLVVQVRLSNTGTDRRLSWAGELGDHTRPLGEITWASGIGVLDALARTWLLPYKPAGAACLCSNRDRDGLGQFIDPGRSITVYAVLPAPSGNPTTTTVVTPVGPPMLDVPITDDPPAGDFPDPDAEPVTPITRRLILASESLDKSEETADDGKDLQINLSADVLFAVDKATLTPKARSVIARTAKLIDASPATVVTVAGHADSSGTDAINNPLSLRRAHAVQHALTALLTRKGVRFHTEGHGSHRPLYRNDTDEGKRRNRRVTVTFPKPQPAAQEPGATTTTGTTDLTGTTTADGQPITMNVTGLRRLPAGLGLLTYTITNEGSSEAWFRELHHAQDWEAYKYQAATNVRLTDVTARRQYLPGRLEVPTDNRTDFYCACTAVSGVRISTEKFAPGQTREFWNLFALPDTTTINAKIGPFRDLHIPIR